MESIIKKIVPRLVASNWRPFALFAICLLIIFEVLFLLPSKLDIKKAGSPVSPESLIPPVAPVSKKIEVPQRIADYEVGKFQYISTNHGEKEWKLNSEHAFLYNKEKLVYGKSVVALLFDTEGKTTRVTGQESRYYMNKRDLEIFGSVETQMPDGFVVKSEYFRYFPDKHRIEIPTEFFVSGKGSPESKQKLSFQSFGLINSMQEGVIHLLSKTEVKLTSEKDTTLIKSDNCDIFKNQKMAKFRMESKTALEKRFVQIIQPTYFTRARQADLFYGESGEVINYLVAEKEVLIVDTSKSNEDKKYGTSGRADFDSNHNTIVLTVLPQVYQSNDTVTGESITLYRDSDIVDVAFSNSFSGESTTPKTPNTPKANK
jgi:LPS export ABC transporter protein LptC